MWSILKPPRDIFSFISRPDAAGEGRELSFTWDQPLDQPSVVTFIWKYTVARGEEREPEIVLALINRIQ